MVQSTNIACATVAAGVSQSANDFAFQEQTSSLSGRHCPNCVPSPWNITKWHCYDEIAVHETRLNRRNKLCHNPCRFSRVPLKTKIPIFCGRQDSKRPDQVKKSVAFFEKMEENNALESSLMITCNDCKRSDSEGPFPTANQRQETFSESSGLKPGLAGNQCHGTNNSGVSCISIPCFCQPEKEVVLNSGFPLICDTYSPALEGATLSSYEIPHSVGLSASTASALSGEGESRVSFTKDESVLRLNNDTSHLDHCNGSLTGKDYIGAGTATAEIAVMHMNVPAKQWV
jgi:hypothetical protein